MAFAFAHLELYEGDLSYMSKLKATHFSGNNQLLGFDITADTSAVSYKETTRKGQRYTHKYGLTLKNLETGAVLGIQLASKPGKDVIHGTVNVSGWEMRRTLSRNDYCTVEFGKKTVEIVFFKEERFGEKKFKINSKGEMLKDQEAVYDAIKYLKLDAHRVNQPSESKII